LQAPYKQPEPNARRSAVRSFRGDARIASGWWQPVIRPASYLGVQMRSIDDILYFRGDISPFLAHLTKARNVAMPASRILTRIIKERRLVAGSTKVSDGRFGMYTLGLSEAERLCFFGGICFTETPLSEVHSLLEIAYRSVDLAPYGLVFLKDRLCAKGVSPVVYINNERGDQDLVFQALCSLANTRHDEACKILPLLSVFGMKITPPGAVARPAGAVDFRWEREWRYPYSAGALEFDENDVFVGLCPHDSIARYEGMFPGVGFIDPRRNMKWYATKLVEARQRLNIKFSVV